MVNERPGSQRRNQSIAGLAITIALGLWPVEVRAQAFDEAVHLEAGDITLGVAIVDMDADGRNDVVVALHETDRVGVFRNTGTASAPSFADIVTFPTGLHPQGVAIADIDGDGKPDVATANSGRAGGGSVAVIRNVSSVGTISLEPPVTQPFDTAHRIRIADLDGDGALDLVATSNASKTIAVFQNTSTPGVVSFQNRVAIGGAGFLRPLALGDIDGDSRVDIVIAVKDVGKAYVFRNISSPGTFAFAGGVDFTAGNTPEDVALGDLDADGRLEILIANDFANTVTILHNASVPGTVSFDSAVAENVGMRPGGVLTGDVDGLVGPDMLTADALSGTLTVLRHHGAATDLDFSDPRSFSAGSTPLQLALGDVDGDGRNDVVLTDNVVHTIAVFRNAIRQGLQYDPFLESLPVDQNAHSLRQATVSAVMDHYLPREGVPATWLFPYNCATTSACQTASVPCGDALGRKRTVAFDGQLGKQELGENATPSGYRASCNGEYFVLDAFAYAGSAGGGTGECVGGLTDPPSYLDYDGHSGYDFNLPGASDLGDPILAAADGWLEVPEEDLVNAPCSGNAQQFNALRVVHSNGLETWYLHALEGSECIPFRGTGCSGPDDPLRPQPGDAVWVTAGTRIASVGDTGTTSPHLHFEVRDSASQQPIDPFGCSDETRVQDPPGCPASNLWSLIFKDGFESGDLSAWQP